MNKEQALPSTEDSESCYEERNGCAGVTGWLAAVGVGLAVLLMLGALLAGAMLEALQGGM